MEAQLEKIRETQKDAWNKSSAGWKKWDVMMMDFLQPMNNEMIRMMHLKDDDIVLDVATGTGEPGLTIAALLKHGKVVGTDLAEEMLAIAREKASKSGIRNFETICCDVSELPFDKNSFNSVCCRLGFMFFPDIQIALNEMVRVLKPGGRIAISVWGAREKNFWINASMETMISALELTLPVSGAPGLFRCSDKEQMAELFRGAGLKNIKEKQLEVKLKCGTIENYWSFITEVASPVAFGKAHPDLKQSIMNEVMAKVNRRCPDGNIEIESCSLILSGEKL